MSMPSGPGGSTLADLRRCVFAVAVLHDLDLEPGPDGVTLCGPRSVVVSWAAIAGALGRHTPDSSAGRQQVAELMRLRRLAHVAPPGLVRAAVTVVGWPADAPDHPGPGWPLLHVPGGSLHLGPAVVGLAARVAPATPTNPSATAAPQDGWAEAPGPAVPVSADALEAAGVPVQPRWSELLDQLETAGQIAADRSRRRSSSAPLRSTGAFDVVTLLGSECLRRWLAHDAGGMAALVVPMRTRGWIASSALDSAFGPAAFLITEPEDRGFARPLLVTAHEVQQVPAGGHAARHLFGDRKSGG